MESGPYRRSRNRVISHLIQDRRYGPDSIQISSWDFCRLTSLGQREGGAAIATPRALDVSVSAGTLRVCHYEGPAGRLVMGIPGLGGNARCFDFLAERLTAAGHAVVNVDLRGRGHSSVTALGSYGWRQHARDVLEVAGRFSPGQVDVVGHSMGALVAMQAAALAPGTVRRIVDLDAVGLPDPVAAAVV